MGTIAPGDWWVEHETGGRVNPCPGGETALGHGVARTASLMGDRGLYQVTFHLVQNLTISVGALDVIHFPPGWYTYTGSARRHLHARLRRHLDGTGTVRWHVDYLRRQARPVAWRMVPLAHGTECNLVQDLVHGPGCARFPLRFGASDCRCGGHLAMGAAAPWGQSQ